jgi:hypothetical protein
MMKKRLLLIAVLSLAVAVTVLVMLPAMLPPRPGITKANFDRIQDGMTLAEVEAIFGGKKVFYGPFSGPFDVWVADDGSLARIYFSDECVENVYWDDSEESTLDKIRRWLHLPKGD